MDLDLVPRINGVAADVDNTSVVELYKIVSTTYVALIHALRTSSVITKIVAIVICFWLRCVNVPTVTVTVFWCNEVIVQKQ
jgi:hypothetical protein